jgi:hypothetical protein
MSDYPYTVVWVGVDASTIKSLGFESIWDDFFYHLLELCENQKQLDEAQPQIMDDGQPFCKKDN